MAGPAQGGGWDRGHLRPGAAAPGGQRRCRDFGLLSSTPPCLSITQMLFARKKPGITPRTNAFTAELDTSGRCQQSMEVKPVTIQGDSKLDTCRFNFLETEFFLAPLAYMFSSWKRSISLFNDQITQHRENQPAFPEHLHHFRTHLQPGADGQQPALSRLRGGAR